MEVITLVKTKYGIVVTLSSCGTAAPGCVFRSWVACSSLLEHGALSSSFGFRH
jgi:hypothetical protein